MTTNDKRVGEVWLCFEGTKERPVLVLSGSVVKFDIDVIVSRITSKSPRNEFDVKLDYWKEAGLKKPSVVRCSKINTVEHGDLSIKIGTLHDDDLANVLEAVKDVLFRDYTSLK